MTKRLYILPFLFCILLQANAQTHRVNRDGSNATLYDDGDTYLVSESGTYVDGAGNRTTWGRDTTKFRNLKNIPIGQFQWVLEPRLGTVIDAENNDTVVHDFYKWNATDGYTGEYNYLANIGSPRLSRLYFNRDNTSDEFLFLQPFSFFRGSLQDFRFTNTKSPITNLAYHSCGNRQTGEDRIRGYFATNINKLAGFGFKIDYNYGVGYYYAQPNSMFGSTFYGYYRGERYNIHAYAGINHMKMGENGGIEDDRYIEDPLSLGQSYSPGNIPTMLSSTWNRNHEQHFYLSHRYNIGYTRIIELPDSLKPIPPSPSTLLFDLPDSVQAVLREDTLARRLAIDSLMQRWKDEQIVPKEFIPVTSIIHTFDLSNLKHEYLSHSTTKNYYTNNYFGDINEIADLTRAFSVRNTFGIALREYQRVRIEEILVVLVLRHLAHVREGEEKVEIKDDKVEAVDLDGDGKKDAVYVDLDGDGKIDALAVDTDDDGKADKILIDTDKDGNSLSLFDILATEDNIIDDINKKLNLKKIYDYIDSELDEREKQVIYMRYGLSGQKPVTQREVAKVLGVSRSYISRIETKALKTLRRKYERSSNL